MVATLCPPDYRIAGEVQAIGGKWMKMGEKEVVTEKGLLGSAAPETWRAEIGSPPPNRVNCVIPRRLLPWTACHGSDPSGTRARAPIDGKVICLVPHRA